MSARVFTIPASERFLPALIHALRSGTLVAGFPDSTDPLAFSTATLFLPTRRACVLAREAFLDELKPAVLPRIVPLGDIDEDELIFADAANETALDLPPALPPLQRRLLLTQLVMKWAAQLKPATGEPALIVHSPASALALADDLARLIDDMTTRQVDWSQLDSLVPDHLDKYWQLTLDFLKIAREAWPAILQERGAIEPAARRDLLIEAERVRLSTHPGPVIAAGSTGSMPATAKLIAAIATLPHGAVVLPGLDTELDEAAWGLIGGTPENPPVSGHPQLAMHALLRRIGIARGEVVRLGVGSPRSRVVSEAMRPSAATERWAERIDAGTRDTALADVAVIEAGNAEEEALAIAIALREAMHEQKSAALVTPDRALARRVGAALGRWNIVANDSGGDALPDTEAGVFARLAAEVVLEELPPVRLLALLKHARFRLGAAAGAHARAVAALELAVLRGPRPRPGLKGLADALTTFRDEELHPSDPRRSLTPDDLDSAHSLIEMLGAALAPFRDLSPPSFGAIAARHAQALQALSRDDAGNEMAFAGIDGAELARAFEDIAEQPDDFPVSPADYPDLFETAIADRACRRAEIPGAHVRILGPLEARLVNVDRVVLGALVDGVWPPDTRSDPWLSRPMRLALGLDLPERRVSLSAHDFAQLLGTREVILSRAAKLGGAPTVASRFTQRLAAVAGEAHWKDARARGEKYLAWARDLDRSETVTPAKRPRPIPPLNARPDGLSVTQIEDLLRDPYTIYARHILELRPLDAVDTPPGARDRGTVIHGAIGDFTEKYARALPADPLAALLRLGEARFAVLQDFPEARAFWWPRFLRIARWFVDWDATRRADATALHAEIKGSLQIAIGTRTFALRTRADRIEERRDGSYAILDYKTGSTPTEKQVRTGLSPQLTLEGAILRAGGFKEIAGGSIGEVAYVALRGGEPPGEQRPIELKEGTPDAHADRALAMLRGILTRFADPDTPYRSLVSPMWKARYGDYDHLARIKEWSAGGEEEEME
jgi:ATP-dependent helicase/nuclease subunit B